MSQTGVILTDVRAETVTISGVTLGLTAPEVQELTKAAAAGAVSPLTDKIIDLSQKLGVTQGAMRMMLTTVGHAHVPDERLVDKLGEVVAQYRQSRRCHRCPAPGQPSRPGARCLGVPGSRVR